MSPSDKQFAGRFGFILIFAFSITAILLGKLYTIQVAQGENYRTLGSRQVQNTEPIPAIRGNIYDRNQKPLTMNKAQYSFGAHPDKVEDAYALAVQLAQTFDKSRAYYTERLRMDQPFVWLERNVEKALADEFLPHDDAGLVTEIHRTRYYPYSEVASQILGLTDVDGHGINGLEARYDSLLSGKPGWTIMRMDGHGASMPSPAFPTIKPVNGYDVETTLDFEYQTILEEALRDGMRTSGAEKGMALVMNPRTGAILAMTSLPSYNPNFPARAKMEHMKNRLVTDIFEPGSTTKIVAATAAISENLVESNEIFYCENGKIQINGETIHDHKKFGWLTFEDVIVNSSNIGTIKIANRIGRDTFYQYLRRFGFGTPTGVNFPGEVNGIVHQLREWSDISLASASIGHEISVTGLQMANAFAAIANDGYLMQPYLVKQIMDETGRVIQQNKPRVIRQVTSSDVAERMKLILEKVVQHGTGTEAQIEGMRVAGKTGTAQKVINGTYSQKEYLSSFVGFLPVEDPQLLCAVYLDSPEFGQHWGGYAAAPVARKIFAQIISSTDAYFYADAEANSVSARQVALLKGIQSGLHLSSNMTYSGADLGQNQHTAGTQNPHRMPDVTGMSLRKALMHLYALDLEVEIDGYGQVITQSPSAGTHIDPKTQVLLTLED